MNTTVTVWPSSTPVVVPETMTVSSSDALTMLSTSSVVAIVKPVGAVLSSVMSFVASAAALPAASVAFAVIAIVPSLRPLISAPAIA